MRRPPVTGSLVLSALLALALAGCGTTVEGDGVATAGGAAGGGPSASASAAALDDADRQLKFAQCMRENGVDMPDPDPAAPGRVRIGGGDGDQGKTQAALEKCRDLLPNGGQARKLDPEQAESMRKMAQCMRENGFPDFPDPGPDGMLKLDKSLLGGKGLDDPTLKAAMDTCEQYKPKMAGGGK